MRHNIISDDCDRPNEAATCSGNFAVARLAEKRGLDNHIRPQWPKSVSTVGYIPAYDRRGSLGRNRVAPSAICRLSSRASDHGSREGHRKNAPTPVHLLMHAHRPQLQTREAVSTFALVPLLKTPNAPAVCLAPKNGRSKLWLKIVFQSASRLARSADNSTSKRIVAAVTQCPPPCLIPSSVDGAPRRDGYRGNRVLG
jgi:hypothetical protein